MESNPKGEAYHFLIWNFLLNTWNRMLLPNFVTRFSTAWDKIRLTWHWSWRFNVREYVYIQMDMNIDFLWLNLEVQCPGVCSYPNLSMKSLFTPEYKHEQMHKCNVIKIAEQAYSWLSVMQRVMTCCNKLACCNRKWLSLCGIMHESCLDPKN